jgi:ECF transporter S component (folate family)
MQNIQKVDGFFSRKGVFTPKNLVVMAMMVALAAILSRFSIYITPTFKAISFAYLPGAITAMLFGPWAALVYGLASDTLNYFANPQGGYFPGYALSEMLSYFIYACFLYKRPVSFVRVLIARILILITVVFGLNYLWMNIMYGSTAGSFFTGARLINNLVQLPFHTLLITFVAKPVLRAKELYL